MFFWRSAAVKTVKRVENTSFNKKLGETTFPYPVPISEKFLQNIACQRIMAEIDRRRFTVRCSKKTGLSAGTGKLCIFGHLGLVFIWSCFVSCLLLLLYYVICAPVLTEGTKKTTAATTKRNKEKELLTTS